MRILVDHSGYGLLNIGDIAMLQACISRMWMLWPDAEIDVFTESPERLEQFCPGTRAVSPTVVGRGRAAALPLSGQLAAEQIWKIVGPFLARSGRGPDESRSTIRRQQDAVRWADIVVSSGGGFINDVFWWHGAGVLSVLAMAQRLDKPTAMFGQGIGPLTHPLLTRMVKLTMRRLHVVGLREGVRSSPLLLSLGVAQELIEVTGDDALLLATAPTRPCTGGIIGVNVRVAAYSHVDADFGAQVVSVTRRAAAERGCATVALPIENNKSVSDLRALNADDVDPRAESGENQFSGVETPQELMTRIADCRLVVTGSYHAAVFALAAGIPAVCITNSAYYDGKFKGLAELFPGGCHIVRPGPHFEKRLNTAIDNAWDTGEVGRDDIHAAALAQVAKAAAVYQRFKVSATPPITDSTRRGAPLRTLGDWTTIEDEK